MMLNPRGVLSSFGPEVTSQRTSISSNIQSRSTASFYDIKDWDWHVLSDLSPEGPREFIGGAGDVVLWHAFLCHTGSVNVKDVPRFGLFARYSHKKREEIKYEIPEDLWKYWAI